ncbi:MAG: hydrolase [Corynebacterium marinum]|jgi:lysophospholipase L1-like esterase|uniref:Hydrolase n=1 Tax=Corynebacterium marinum TaxID=349751 RepID=A0A847HC58_9CORY|nr:hydrolase [Corynebacterium marinum]
MFLKARFPLALRPLLLAVLVAGFLPAAGLAHAAPDTEKNLVIFGDSVLADPPLGIYLANENSSGEPVDLSGSVASASSREGIGVGSVGSSAGDIEGICPRSLNNYGIRAAETLNLAVYDHSCNGATVLPRNSALFPNDELFEWQVDRALEEGALGPQTARVIVTLGFNDTYSNATRPEGETRGRFLAAGTEQIQRVRAAAPQARVQIVGYTTIAGGDFICLAHLPGSSATKIPLPVVNYWEGQAQEWQRDLAAAAGVEFLDLKPSTADTGICSPDSLRMWTSPVDAGSGRSHLPFHLNQRGHEHVGAVVAAS